MARTNNLTNFLTDVAGAIKEKKAYPEGTKIAAADFDSEIASIETGIKLPEGIAVQADYPAITTEEAIWIKEQSEPETEGVAISVEDKTYVVNKGHTTPVTYTEAEQRCVDYITNEYYDPASVVACIGTVVSIANETYVSVANMPKASYEQQFVGYEKIKFDGSYNRNRWDLSYFLKNGSTSAYPLTIFHFVNGELDWVAPNKDGDSRRADAYNALFTEGAHLIINAPVQNVSTGSIVVDKTPDSVFVMEKLLDTSKADATASDILEGKTAFVNNTKVVGTLVPAGEAKLNVFVQEEEPETKNGIWIKCNKTIENIEIIEKSPDSISFVEGLTDLSANYTGTDGSRANAIAVGDDIYVIGYNILNSAGAYFRGFYKYNVPTDTWTALADPTWANQRAPGWNSSTGNGILTYYNGNIYYEWWGSKGIYNIETDTWTSVTGLSGSEYTIGVGIDNYIYLYNPSSKNFMKAEIGASSATSLISCPGTKVTNNTGACSMTYANGCIYLYIGTVGEFWEYDINAGAWTQIHGDVNFIDNVGYNYGVTICAQGNNILFLGISSDDATDDTCFNNVGVFDTVTREFKHLDITSPFRLGRPTAVSIGNKTYMINSLAKINKNETGYTPNKLACLETSNITFANNTLLIQQSSNSTVNKHQTILIDNAYNIKSDFVRTYIYADGKLNTDDLTFVGNGIGWEFISGNTDSYWTIDESGTNYIKADGSQYIDTGIKATSNIKYQAKFKCTYGTGTIFIGMYAGSDSYADRFFFTSDNGYMYLDRGSATYRTSSSSNWLNKDLELEIGNTYIKNLETGSNIATGTTHSFDLSSYAYNIGVFGCSYNNVYDKGIVYYLKIYDGDTLVRDFVPAVNSFTHEAALYDKVSGKYYKSGTSKPLVYGTV